MIKVEVAYALPEEQVIIPVQISSGGTVKDAIEASGVMELYPEIDLAKNKVGVFSKLSKLEHPLKQGDRVEIYRPLLIDPKEVRRQRAAKQK